MRYSGVIGLIVLVWLLIGVLAVWQRGYFKGEEASCATAGNIALTVIAGPLNYAGVNPKVTCHLPQPSSMKAVHIQHVIGMESP
jgi:Tfp pilus assembly protein PilW